MVAAVVPRLRLPALRARTWVALALLLTVALTAGWFWLRDSSLVAVEQVEVVGASGNEQAEVVRALTQAAQEMTTLNVDEERLRAAVEVYPQVKDLRIEADLLHRMRIEVVERSAVAALAVGDERTPIAADGTLLDGHVADERLPAVPAAALPAGGTLTGGQARTALDVLAAAPEATRAYVETVEIADDGTIEAQLRGGPVVLFGSADEAYAKWIATGRVLNDPGSSGATYIDVRLPERPAAGGFDGEAPTSTGA
jgi:cell division protein FtsQ